MQATFDGRVTRTPATLSPERPSSGDGESHLNISVIYTSEPATLAALKAAAALANRLEGRITLVVPQVVSYQLPLHQPPVPREWSEDHARTLAAQTPVETTVRFYLCRDQDETLARVLKPHSLIVIGAKKRFWPTSASLLARRLRRLGHEVILTETE